MTQSPPPAKDRLIVALDVATKDEALHLVDDLDGLVSFFKVGYQLFLAVGMDFVRELVRRRKNVFLDLKMDDVEETIFLAVGVIAREDVRFLTIHGSGATTRAALKGRGQSNHPKILSVTLLTSLNQQDLADLNILGPKGRFADLDQYVEWRAEQAITAGSDGLIASGSSVGSLRKKFGNGPLIVCPGIRQATDATNDHKRPATAREAMAAGADYLVVGRPIRDASDRRAKADSIIEDIEAGMRER
jgi:orotidine-5'-phosphate decarboxylase